MLCLVVAFFSPKNRAAYNVMAGLRFNWSIMKPLLRFGYPAGIEFFLNLTAFTAAIFIFHSRGAETAAAVTILFNWDMLTFIPLIGIQIGVMSLVGRYMGASDPETASRAAISGLKCGWMYSAVMMIMFIGFSGHLVEMFRPSDPEKLITFQQQVVPMALFLVKTIAFYTMMEAVVIVFSGALRGAGDTIWAMCISVSMHWIIVPVLYIMLKVFDASAEAGWVAFISIFMCCAFVFYLRFKTGKWKTIKVIDHEEEVPLPHSDFHETPDL
jgi:MATE family multidrug resistance protein